MVLGVILYFLFATGVLACCFVPAVRDRICGRVLHVMGSGRVAWRRWSGAGDRAARRLGAARAGVRAWLGARRGPLLAAAVVVLLLPALALALRAAWRFEAYDHTRAREVDAHVAALLQGESLVPPPPLPPELFATQEVEAVHPMVGSASRDWMLLDEEFRRRLLLLFKLLKEQHGYEAVLIEGYRSTERQQALARLGPTVTRADAHQSYHQHGLAADVAFLREGRIVISERDPWARDGYERYGELAASLGLVWGGQWRGLADLGHVELRRSGVLARPGPASSAAGG
jgi:peptidoglycan L-alanyl-D-glutamate endopeptidase CwlK